MIDTINSPIGTRRCEQPALSERAAQIFQINGPEQADDTVVALDRFRKK
jgi:hypothetical protein